MVLGTFKRFLHTDSSDTEKGLRLQAAIYRNETLKNARAKNPSSFHWIFSTDGISPVGSPVKPPQYW
jgi:hypothetical protein